MKQSGKGGSILPQKNKDIITLLKSNKGSGMVTVLVAMFFLAILGITVMFMSYTGLLIKTTERRGVDNFYTASEIMDAIKLGFEEVVSDTLSVSYKTALMSDTAITFDDVFLQELNSWTTKIDPSDATLFRWNTSINPVFVTQGLLNPVTGEYPYSYEPIVLANFVVKAGILPADISVNGFDSTGIADATKPVKITTPSNSSGDSTDNVVSVHSSGGVIEKIVFNDITVTYTSPTTNVTTVITTDISMEVPDYVRNTNIFRISTIPDFSMIARDDFVNNSSLLTIDGSMYAGSLELNGDTTIQNGEVVTPGSIIVNDRFEVSGTYTGVNEGTVYADEVLLQDNDSALTVDGALLVADDLTINGFNATVDINGTYYGFGDHITDPSLSSSIIVNGLNADMSFDPKSTLTLAGHSFITQSSAIDPNTGVLMGESLSIRPNQLVYLIPASELQMADGTALATNPYMPTTNTVPALPTLKNPVAGVTVAQLVYNLPSAGNPVVVYYFYQFASVQATNDYFLDYFNNNTDKISSYLDSYLAALSELPVDNIAAAGNLVGQEDGTNDYYIPNQIGNVDGTAVNRMNDFYAELCRTLNTPNVAASIGNPYDLTLNITELESFFGGAIPAPPATPSVWEFTEFGGTDTVAVVVSGSINTNSIPSTTRVILTTPGSNITVSSNFTGLIVAGGDATINPGVLLLDADNEAVNDAFSATYTSGGTTYTFGDFMTIANNLSAAVSDTDDATKLVSFENWHRS